MPQKFKVIERIQPGIPGGGQKKFYALPVSGGEFSLDDLIKVIEKRSTLSGADLLAAIYSLVEATADALENGITVRLGDLGSLRMSFSSAGKEKREDINASAIRGAKIIFHPGQKLKDIIANMEYVKQ